MSDYVLVDSTYRQIFSTFFNQQVCGILPFSSGLSGYFSSGYRIYARNRYR